MSGMKQFVVLGGGGHAKVVLSMLKALKLHVAGYVDRTPTELSTTLKYLGSDDLFLAETHPWSLANGIGMVQGGPTLSRQEIFLRFKSPGIFFFDPLVHPFSWIADNVELYEGCQIMAGAVVQPFSKIGQNSIINSRAVVEHDCVLGSTVHIAPGAIVCGGVKIGNNVHIGAGSVILQGLQIGDNATIGAGAVVVRDLPPNAKAYGVPAREK